MSDSEDRKVAGDAAPTEVMPAVKDTDGKPVVDVKAKLAEAKAKLSRPGLPNVGGRDANIEAREAAAAVKPVVAPVAPKPESVAPVAPARAEETSEPSNAEPSRPASRAAAPAAARSARPARVRKARLRLARIDPWSMMKTALLFSIAGGIIFWVATYIVWAAIDSSGLFEAINKFVSNLVDNPNDPKKFQLEQYISGNKVLGAAAGLAVVDVVIMTALATLGSFLYNLSATMLGGLEVTLAED